MSTNDTSRLSCLLTRSNIKSKDLESVMKKLNSACEDGASKLCVMADFDFTITKRWINEGKTTCPSTYDVIKRSELIDKHCSDNMKALFLKYWPIETDPHMSVEEKTPFIVEWLGLEMKAMKEAGLTERKLALMMETHGLVPRDHFSKFCATISNAQVPFIVSTAGLADVVEGALRGWNLYTDNMAIIGNRFSWDPETGSLLGIKGEIVHTLNKEVSMKNFFADPSSNDNATHNNNRDNGSGENATFRHPRPNVILLGDSLGDARMTLDLDFAPNVIKIGFLNDAVPDSKLEAFLSTFDIVLINEDSVDVPLALVAAICDNRA